MRWQFYLLFLLVFIISQVKVQGRRNNIKTCSDEESEEKLSRFKINKPEKLSTKKSKHNIIDVEGDSYNNRDAKKISERGNCENIVCKHVNGQKTEDAKPYSKYSKKLNTKAKDASEEEKDGVKQKKNRKTTNSIIKNEIKMNNNWKTAKSIIKNKKIFDGSDEDLDAVISRTFFKHKNKKENKASEQDNSEQPFQAKDKFKKKLKRRLPKIQESEKASGEDDDSLESNDSSVVVKEMPHKYKNLRNGPVKDEEDTEESSEEDINEIEKVNPRYQNIKQQMKKISHTSEDDDDSKENNSSEEDLPTKTNNKKSKGKNVDNESNNDYSGRSEMEDGETEDVTQKKKVKYISKFAHEKNARQKKTDSEIDSIMRIHRKADADFKDKKTGLKNEGGKHKRYNDDSDEDSSEELVPKRIPFIEEDED